MGSRVVKVLVPVPVEAPRGAEWLSALAVVTVRAVEYAWAAVQALVSGKARRRPPAGQRAWRT